MGNGEEARVEVHGCRWVAKHTTPATLAGRDRLGEVPMLRNAHQVRETFDADGK